MLQEVKDKFCIRVIEKLRNQLNGDRTKSAANQDTTLVALDDNAEGICMHKHINTACYHVVE